MKKLFLLVLVLCIMTAGIAVQGIAAAEYVSGQYDGETYEVLGNDKAGYLKAPGVWNNFYTLGDTQEQRSQLYEIVGQQQWISGSFGELIVTCYGYPKTLMGEITQETDRERMLEDLMSSVLYSQYSAYDEPNYRIGYAVHNEDDSVGMLLFVFDEAEEPAYTPMLTYIHISNTDHGYVWVFEKVDDTMYDLVSDMISSFSATKPENPKHSDNQEDVRSFEIIIGEREAVEYLGNEKAGYVRISGEWRDCQENGIAREFIDEAYELYGQETWIDLSCNLVVTYSGYDRQQLRSITSKIERDQVMIDLGDYALDKIIYSFDAPETTVHNAFRNPDGSTELLFSVLDTVRSTSVTFIFVHVSSDDRGYVWMFENIYDEAGASVMAEMLDSFTTSNPLTLIVKPTATPSPKPTAIPSPTPTTVPTATPAAAPTATPAAEPVPFKAGEYEAVDYGNGTCQIRRYNGTEADVKVPAQLNGLKVISIGSLVTGGAPGMKTVQSVTIPEGVESLGAFLFEGTEKLTTFNIPASVTQISPWIFDFIDVPRNICIAQENPVLEYKNGFLIDKKQKKLIAYWGNAQKISIPENIEIIGEYAFIDYEAMTGLTIPESVRTIEVGAFKDCKNLKRVSIPSSVTSIGASAFSYTGITEAEFEDGLTLISSGLFSECTGLKRVRLPSGVTAIEDYAFGGCWNLEEINIPDGVTSIEEAAFLSCYDLKHIALPASLKHIDEDAFVECGLERIYGHNSAAQKLASSLGVRYVDRSNSIASGRTSAEVYLRDAMMGGNLRKLKKGESLTVYRMNPDIDGDIWYYLRVDETGEYGYLRDNKVTLD